MDLGVTSRPAPFNAFTACKKEQREFVDSTHPAPSPVIQIRKETPFSPPVRWPFDFRSPSIIRSRPIAKSTFKPKEMHSPTFISLTIRTQTRSGYTNPSAFIPLATTRRFLVRHCLYTRVACPHPYTPRLAGGRSRDITRTMLATARFAC